jgi:large subunit ribosomal protein L13
MGRLATNIATTLMGKHKPIYDPAGKESVAFVK